MKRKIRVAIAGAGNCASSLIQGVQYYAGANPADNIPGLMHVDLGGYHISDLEFVAAFDVDADKVGKDLGEAIFSGQNNTYRFAAVPALGTIVQRGPTLDGLGKYLRRVITESDAEPVDVAAVLRDVKADVLINYLPVGSEEGARFYAEQALAAGVGFVNCIPVFIAKDPEWRQRFEDADLPIVGDDIKSQVGATITHRVLTRLFEDRGVRVDRTYQLNFGGNTDFMGMLERERLESKKISKTNAVTSQLTEEIGDGERPRRPQRLRALADGPQVLRDSDRGDDLRRCAAADDGSPGSVGQPEQRGRRDRRGAVREAGAGPGDRRHAVRPGQLFHEEPAGAVYG